MNARMGFTYLLVDCNNFYVSCERLFRPDLEGRAVVALSNNDGCVIARSQEAKDLGIAMGAPFFEIKNLCLHRNVFVCSSNYQLYGSLSQRVMNALASFVPDIQMYSIDEAFLRLPAEMDEQAVINLCIKMRKAVKKWMGIPISIGIAPTKTLAKTANKMAKKSTDFGIVSLLNSDIQEKALANFPIGDVWGIGFRLQKRLHSMRIFTALDYRQMDPCIVRNKMGVVGERMLWELRGVSCLPFVEEYPPKKSITSSRSFGVVLTELEHMQEAISTHAATACEKLREEGSSAQALCVFAETLVDGVRRHFNAAASLPFPTNDTPLVIKTAKDLLAGLFLKKQRYKKCGVILLDIMAESNVVPDLFLESPNPKRRKIASVVDSVNAHFGKGSLFYGAAGINPIWKMKSERRSCRYTTCWNELVVAQA